jgi:hypothetical protein
MKITDKCAPAIWRKFTPEQKTWWLRFYNTMNEPMNFPAPFDREDNNSQQLRHVVAHNMATHAVWELNGLVSGE